jgi:hypothetical protein
MVRANCEKIVSVLNPREMERAVGHENLVICFGPTEYYFEENNILC